MVRFEYLEPKTLQKAITFLSRHGDEAKVLAGGTDLLRALKQRTLRPRYLVNIKYIPQISKITSSSRTGLKIGAVCSMGSLEFSPMVKQRSQALFEAVHLLGSPQVRNLATIGGNLCNAAPSAETAAILLARDARAHIFGPKGEMVVPLESFFSGPGQTILKTGELLSHISIPDASPGTGEAYFKHSPRSSMDIAVVGVAAVITLSPSGDTVQRCAIALAAVAPTPIRAHKSESLLVGQVPSEKLISEAARQASLEAKPISDIRGSAEYRRDMVSVMTSRALRLALERAVSQVKA